MKTESADGKEVYTMLSTRSQPQKPAESSAAIPIVQPAPIKEVVEDEDDLEATVPHGTTCKRAGCKVPFVSDEENRIGDGPGTKCVYHPGTVRAPVPCIPPYTETEPRQPIFHEGSKVVFHVFLRRGSADAERSTRVTFVASVVYWNLKNFLRLKGVRKGDIFLSPSRRKTYVLRQTWSDDIGCSLI